MAYSFMKLVYNGAIESDQIHSGDCTDCKYSYGNLGLQLPIHYEPLLMAHPRVRFSHLLSVLDNLRSTTTASCEKCCRHQHVVITYRALSSWAVLDLDGEYHLYDICPTRRCGTAVPWWLSSVAGYPSCSNCYLSARHFPLPWEAARIPCISSSSRFRTIYSNTTDAL